MKYARGKGYLLDGRLSNLSKRHFAQVYTDTSLIRSAFPSLSLCLPASSTSLCRPFGCHPKRINIPTRRSCEQTQTGQNRPSILIYLERQYTKFLLLPVPAVPRPGRDACGSTTTTTTKTIVLPGEKYIILIKFPVPEYIDYQRN